MTTQYAAVTDLLLGNIPLPPYIDPQKVVNDAADEIDSKIGMRYVTPLDFSNNTVLVRPARLLVKRICVALATGRLILAVAAGGEQNQLHAYGASLVQDATASLNMIAAGEIPLEGAAPEGGVSRPTAPLISNVDAESAVEAFYDRIANPNYCYPERELGYTRRPWTPDSDWVL